MSDNPPKFKPMEDPLFNSKEEERYALQRCFLGCLERADDFTFNLFIKDMAAETFKRFEKMRHSTIPQWQIEEENLDYLAFIGDKLIKKMTEEK